MGWTYSGNPTLSSKDQVRFELGDTDIKDQQLQDEEIAYLLAQTPDPYYAAACGCEALASKYSRQADKSLGSLSIQAGARAKAYRDQAATLKQKAVRINGLSGIYLGGQSISEKISFGEDSDRVQPNFQIGEDDITGTASVNSVNPLLGDY